MSIGIIGFGFVGRAIHNFFTKFDNIKVNIYDKYIEEYNNINNIAEAEICYISVPTLFEKDSYNYSAIYDVFEKLLEINYSNTILLKCTVEPDFTNKILYAKFPALVSSKLFYNPEFLSSQTANYDFANQKHIIIGHNPNNNPDYIINFYKTYFPNAEISVASIVEAESAKIFCNTFYAAKIQIFNEFYFACQNNGANFDHVKNMMLKNGWINPMHTSVPGPDGLFSFGGACFPKDIRGLNSYLKKIGSYNEVIEAVISESHIRNS